VVRFRNTAVFRRFIFTYINIIPWTQIGHEPVLWRALAISLIWLRGLPFLWSCRAQLAASQAQPTSKLACGDLSP
jgi:hypothetical protein